MSAHLRLAPGSLLIIACPKSRRPACAVCRDLLDLDCRLADYLHWKWQGQLPQMSFDTEKSRFRSFFELCQSPSASLPLEYASWQRCEECPCFFFRTHADFQRHIHLSHPGLRVEDRCDNPFRCNFRLARSLGPDGLPIGPFSYCNSYYRSLQQLKAHKEATGHKQKRKTADGEPDDEDSEEGAPPEADGGLAAVLPELQANDLDGGRGRGRRSGRGGVRGGGRGRGGGAEDGHGGQPRDKRVRSDSSPSDEADDSSADTGPMVSRKRSRRERGQLTPTEQLRAELRALRASFAAKHVIFSVAVKNLKLLLTNHTYFRSERRITFWKKVLSRLEEAKALHVIDFALADAGRDEITAELLSLRADLAHSGSDSFADASDRITELVKSDPLLLYPNLDVERHERRCDGLTQTDMWLDTLAQARSADALAALIEELLSVINAYDDYEG
jgi:hypothetical protein